MSPHDQADPLRGLASAGALAGAPESVPGAGAFGVSGVCGVSGVSRRLGATFFHIGCMPLRYQTKNRDRVAFRQRIFPSCLAGGGDRAGAWSALLVDMGSAAMGTLNHDESALDLDPSAAFCRRPGLGWDPGARCRGRGARLWRTGSLPVSWLIALAVVPGCLLCGCRAED